MIWVLKRLWRSNSISGISKKKQNSFRNTRQMASLSKLYWIIYSDGGDWVIKNKNNGRVWIRMVRRIAWAPQLNKINLGTDEGRTYQRKTKLGRKFKQTRYILEDQENKKRKRIICNDDASFEKWRIFTSKLCKKNAQSWRTKKQSQEKLRMRAY